MVKAGQSDSRRDFSFLVPDFSFRRRAGRGVRKEVFREFAGAAGRGVLSGLNDLQLFFQLGHCGIRRGDSRARLP